MTADQSVSNALDSLRRYQVVIIGGGPVGLALAVDLGLRSISCALVERRLEPHRIPKGQNLTQRTLERLKAVTGNGE